MTLPGTPTNIGVRAYGILANTALEELLPLSEDMARSVALYYRVVGQTASLIMLESEQQYNDYNILESHPFSSVQNINPAQAIESISEEASRVARSGKQGGWIVGMAKLVAQKSCHRLQVVATPSR